MVALGFIRRCGLGIRREGGVRVARKGAAQAGKEPIGGHIPLITETVRPPVGHIKALYHSRRGTAHKCIRRDIPSYHGVPGNNRPRANGYSRENRDVAGYPYVVPDDNGAVVEWCARLKLVPVVVDDGHVRRDHDHVADTNVVPHVDGYPAVDGDMVADRQPGTVLDEDAHGHGVAERREPVTEGGLAANVELDLPPDNRIPAEPRRGELGAHVSAPNLHEKPHGVKKTKIILQRISHDHLCPLVMSGRNNAAGVSAGSISAGRQGATSPRHLAFQQQISSTKDFRRRESKRRNCG